MSDANKISFARDIQPLFRDFDIASMKKARHFDLSNYDDVSARADKILTRLKAGDMPCDGAWPDQQVAKFGKWIDDGKQR